LWSVEIQLRGTTAYQTYHTIMLALSFNYKGSKDIATEITDIHRFRPSHSYLRPSVQGVEADPLKPTRGSGERCKLPQQGPGLQAPTVAFCCIVCSQNESGCSISGSLVSIAMSGKMKGVQIMAAPYNRQPCSAEHLEARTYLLAGPDIT